MHHRQYPPRNRESSRQGTRHLPQHTLHILSRNYYPGLPLRLLGDEKHNSLITSFLDAILRASKAEKPVEIAPQGRALPPFGLDVAWFADGEAYYLGLTKRRKSDDEASEKFTLCLKKSGHIYDMFSHKYLGQSDSITLLVEPVVVRLYGILPYRVEGTEVSVPRSAIKRVEILTGEVSLKDPPAKTVRHIIHIEALRPDRRSARYLTPNLETTNGRASFALPFALNECKGEWTLLFTELVSGSTARLAIRVE